MSKLLQEKKAKFLVLKYQKINNGQPSANKCNLKMRKTRLDMTL